MTWISFLLSRMIGISSVAPAFSAVLCAPPGNSTYGHRPSDDLGNSENRRELGKAAESFGAVRKESNQQEKEGAR